MEIETHAKFDEMVDPKKLKDHNRNPNKHGQDQIERLADLYKYHGIRIPIIVSKLSGMIVSGHCRKLASIRAGLKEVPVVYQDFKDADAEYAFIVSENAIASWAELDFAAINAEIPNFDPSFDLDNFAIKDFKLDYAEKEEKTHMEEERCPTCGHKQKKK